MDLPSPKELEYLLEERGNKALAMYAWRGALRALPLLGRQPIDASSKENMTSHCFSLLRVHWLLYWYCTSDKITDSEILKQAAINVRSAWGYYSASAAAYAVDAAINDDTDNAIVAAYAATYADAADTTYTVAYADAQKANRTDYQFLLNKLNSITTCYQQPLWPDGTPDEVLKNWNRFFADLTVNKLDFLADDIKQLSHDMGRIVLRGNVVLPKHTECYLELPSKSITSSADALRIFLQGKALSENQAVRAMLIGPGGAGKTSLWHLLTSRDITEKPKVTKGVEYHDHTPVKLHQHLSALIQVKGWENLNLYLWDFGGQAIFHSLHSAFMKENCVYIVVVDSRHEQAPDEWLYQIDDLTDGNAEVLLVTNFFDEVEREQNITSLLRRFDRLLTRECFFNFSCQSADESFDLFVKKLVETALKSRRKILPCVQQAAKILEGDEFIKIESIPLKKLNMLLAGSIEKEQITLAIDGLKILGRLVPLVGKDYCLKPEWIINQAYRLVSSSVVVEHQGIVDDPLVWQVLDNESESMDDNRLSEQVIGFLQSLDLCITLNDDEDFEQYFIPDAATASEPTEVQVLVNTPEALTFAYELRYLPAKLKAQLIKQLFENPDIHLDLPAGVWRDGVIVYSKNSEDLIVVEYQYRRQRIELTLIGAPDGDLPKLLGAIDTALEKISGRQLIGHMRLEDKGRDMPCSAFNHMQAVQNDNTNRQDMVDMLVEAIKKFGINLTIQQVNEMKANSDNISAQNVSNSAIGSNASNTVNISNSYNTNHQLTTEQKEDLIQALNQLVQQVATQGADINKLQLLTDAKTVIEQNAEPQNEQTLSFLEKFYGVMAEVDKVAGMAEKANKYIGPLVEAGVRYLGLI